MCEGIAEIALDGSSGGVVTMVNAGAIRPGDAGLDGSANHELTQNRVKELFKEELARVKGRVVKDEGSLRWKGKVDAEKVKIEFIDIGTYLGTAGSREDLSKEEVSVWT